MISKDRPFRILIVDDESFILRLLDKIFSKHYTVQKASNGQEALEAVNKEHPDIIITDISMPLMNGFELCKIIKTKPQTCHISVFMITGMDSDEDYILGFEHGADDYISKPFNSEILLRKVQNHLSTKQSYIGKTQAPVNKLRNHLHHSATEIVLQNLSDYNFKTACLADALHVSLRQLQRRFKIELQCTPNEFIRNIRIQKAHELLQIPGSDIESIASEVGFTDISYFKKCMKSYNDSSED